MVSVLSPLFTIHFNWLHCKRSRSIFKTSNEAIHAQRGMGLPELLRDRAINRIREQSVAQYIFNQAHLQSTKPKRLSHEAQDAKR